MRLEKKKISLDLFFIKGSKTAINYYTQYHFRSMSSNEPSIIDAFEKKYIYFIPIDEFSIQM